jgi:hypothetical protein
VARRRAQKGAYKESKPGSDIERVVAAAAALVAHDEGRQAVHIGGSRPPEQQNHTHWKHAGRMRAVRGRV